MFDMESAACSQFKQIEAERQENDFSINGWKETLPWIFYDSDPYTVRNDETILMKMAFEAGQVGRDHRLRFVLSSYTLNGTWLGYAPLGTQFYYCGRAEPHTEDGGGSNRPTRWLKYGGGVHAPRPSGMKLRPLLSPSGTGTRATTRSSAT